MNVLKKQQKSYGSSYTPYDETAFRGSRTAEGAASSNLNKYKAEAQTERMKTKIGGRRDGPKSASLFSATQETETTTPPSRRDLILGENKDRKAQPKDGEGRGLFRSMSIGRSWSRTSQKGGEGQSDQHENVAGGPKAGSEVGTGGRASLSKFISWGRKKGEEAAKEMEGGKEMEASDVKVNAANKENEEHARDRAVIEDRKARSLSLNLSVFKGSLSRKKFAKYAEEAERADNGESKHSVSSLNQAESKNTPEEKAKDEGIDKEKEVRPPGWYTSLFGQGGAGPTTPVAETPTTTTA